MSVKSKMAVAAFVAMGLVSMNSMAAGNNGVVTFTGEVVDSPCNLAPGQDGTDIKVDFGQLSMAQLNNGMKTNEKFVIKLENCALNGKTAGITFSSQNANTAKTLIGADGTATGLGIGISGITFDTEKPLNALTDGNNTLPFTAVAQRAVDTVNVTAGDFEAISNFVISYK